MADGVLSAKAAAGHFSRAIGVRLCGRTALKVKPFAERIEDGSGPSPPQWPRRLSSAAHVQDSPGRSSMNG